MEYIATAALVVIAGSLVIIAFDLRLIRDSLHRINCALVAESFTISLSQEDRDLLANFRRRKPKKETL